MLVNALLLSSDAPLVALLRRSAEELGIRPLEVVSVKQAGTLAATRRFEGIVVDVDDLAEAADFVEALRKTPSNKSSIIVAVVNGRTTPMEAFRKGANMVLEKPVTADKLVRSLRAAHSMMTRERRRALRVHVDMAVLLKLSAGPEERATATDISEGGLGVEALVPLKLQEVIRFRCMLPDSDIELQGTALVVNATKDGHAGLSFVGVAKQQRAELADWLAARIERQSASALGMTPQAGAPSARSAAGR
jgi:ActR/RegA family two-component response regulator